MDKILAWTKTSMFREVCVISGFDHAETSAKIRNIAGMPLRIRRDLVHSLIKASRGQLVLDAGDSGGGEAERKG